MGQIITVTSGKGGTGKTTTVAAVASCLSVLGHKTLAIDFDNGMGNLDLALGMTGFTVMDYMDIVSGTMEIEKACTESPHIPNLFFLSSPISGELGQCDRDAVAGMLSKVRELFDYCVIDSPPGIGSGFAMAHCNTDLSIIVTTGDLPAMRDAARATTALRDMGVENIRLVVNKVQPDYLKFIRTTIDDIIDTTGARLIGLIAYDRNVFRSLHKNIPLVLYNKRKAAYGFLDTTRRILGENIPLRRIR